MKDSEESIVQLSERSSSRVLAELQRLAQTENFKSLPPDMQKEVMELLGPKAKPVVHEPTLRLDPAIERWRLMRDHIHEGFRFTRYNTGPALWYAVAIPVAFYAMAYYTKDKWDWSGKRREDSLLRKVPEPSTK
ncbi:hypothetical protein CALCODRAFT_493267 [Calocera cornea HHB12733]|uniref:Complex I-B15 n=1 Tax=Calocera cornea HHB12733 TaxID=1353952 RepID=A0A165HUJ4_9BASI|nr:hypothetical protein CALCODRAFT_493267 [Calocera cornea HHB12733]